MTVVRLFSLALALSLSLLAAPALAQATSEPSVAPQPKTPEAISAETPAAPAATSAAAPVLVPDPSGSYTVTGGSVADESDYRGMVTVVRTGASYTIIWTIDNETVTGVGVLAGDVLAVGFPDDDKDAVALYRRQGDGSWVGQWAALGDTALNPEVWQPKP